MARRVAGGRRSSRRACWLRGRRPCCGCAASGSGACGCSVGASGGRRRALEGEGIALLEGGNILDRLHAVGADHDQVAFQHRDGFVDELHQRGRGLRADGRVHRVLEDVRQFAGNLVEELVAIGSAGAGHAVRRDVEALDVLIERIGVLQNARVLAQELQMLAGFLEEELDHLRAGSVHASPPRPVPGWPMVQRLLQQPCSVHDRLIELHRSVGHRFGVAEEEIAARLQILVKALDQLGAQLLAEINQHVHAEDAVEASQVDRLRQVHGRELHHLAKHRLHLVAVAPPGKVGGDLAAAKDFPARAG